MEIPEFYEKINNGVYYENFVNFRNQIIAARYATFFFVKDIINNITQ